MGGKGQLTDAANHVIAGAQPAYVYMFPDGTAKVGCDNLNGAFGFNWKPTGKRVDLMGHHYPNTPGPGTDYIEVTQAPSS